MLHMIKNSSLLSPSGPVETIQLGDGNGSPLKSVTGPYDATALHTFIRETFPGTILLEEHQVSTSLSPLNVHLYAHVYTSELIYVVPRESTVGEILYNIILYLIMTVVHYYNIL